MKKKSKQTAAPSAVQNSIKLDKEKTEALAAPHTLISHKPRGGICALFLLIVWGFPIYLVIGKTFF
jgi:hypothetical protein